MFHSYSHHYTSHIGQQLAGSMVHGFGWGIGSRLAHSLPLGLIIVLALIIVAWYVFHRRQV
jgi:hypothetical protein